MTTWIARPRSSRCGVSRETALANRLAHKRPVGRSHQRLYYIPGGLQDIADALCY